MKTSIQFRFLLALVALGVVLSAFAPMGAHSFKVSLDDQIVADQYVSRNMVAPKITVDPAGNHKKLIVRYNECGRTVTGRVITLKDNDNKVLKEMRFEGTAKGFENPMSCDVKDIVALKPTSGNTMKLYYSSAEFPAGQHVATLVIGPGNTTASN